MDEENKVEATETSEEKDSAPSQEKPKRTEKETTAFNLRKQAEKAKELGIDPAEVLGIKPTLNIEEGLPEDTPLTVGTLKEFQRQEAKKTALQMADDVSDEQEREEIKQILSSRIIPSGDAQRDFEFARTAVNAERTTRIAQEQARKGEATRGAAGGSSPARASDDFEPTAEELIFMRPPYNLSKEKIIARRQQEQ